MVKRRRPLNRLSWLEFAPFIDVFGEESDRGLAVLGAAYLDECLRQLIANFLVNDSKEDSKKVEKLLEGALQHFGPRIRASYCMGLISREEYHDLQIIRKIRRRFAHDLHGVSFSAPRVKDQCSSLQLPERVNGWPGERNARNLFKLTTKFLAFTLLTVRIPEAREQRRAVPSGFGIKITM